MPNTLTGLIVAVHAALDKVSRELVGFIPSSTRDAKTDRVAVGQQVLVFQTPASTATDITPGVTPPDDGNQNIGNVPVTITKSRRVPFRWNGEEELGLANSGVAVDQLQNDQLEQAIRTLCNEMEVDCWNAIRKAASRAYGTAGTTPFASDLSDPAQIRKILDDNGAPPGERSLIIDTTAGAKLRTIGQLTKANEAGSTMTLRDGTLLDLHGMMIKESAAVQATTKGTGSGYLVNQASSPIGTRIINADTGTGTILAGDIVTFAGDTVNKYVVETALAGGFFVLGGPGLRVAIADNAAITVGNNFTPNVAFCRSSLILATRAPALPKNGDLARDRTMVADPRSGISFEIAMYPQYRQMQYEISAAWGATGIKSAHAAVLLG